MNDNLTNATSDRCFHLLAAARPGAELRHVLVEQLSSLYVVHSPLYSTPLISLKRQLSILYDDIIIQMGRIIFGDLS